MKHSLSRNIGACAIARHLVFGLAYASGISACSGYYPLGQTERSEGLVQGERPAPRAQTGDARVPATLARPDFTIGVPNDGSALPVSAGDLDGDGRDEMALSTWDFASGLAYVHLRHGGPRPRDATEAFAFDQSGARLTLGDASGLHVFAAGDVDGDGYDDLLLKTNDCGVERASSGAYLLYGGPERLEGVLPLTGRAAHFTAGPPRPEASGGSFACEGYPLASAPGDIDGDGFDDLVISSAPLRSAEGAADLDPGAGVYVFYGKAERYAGDISLTAADASLHFAQPVNPYGLGDMNGDGRVDLIVGPDVILPDPQGSFLVAGRAERWSGPYDLAVAGTLLAGAFVDTIDKFHGDGDLDGDGIDDVVLRTALGDRHLFYGAPGLFAEGVDWARADATFGGFASLVYAVGDLDGDGDDELLDRFANPDSSIAHDLTFLSSNIALASGSRERLGGVFVFPESEVLAQAPDGFFEDELGQYGRSGRALDTVIPAGDLDGDGAQDLFTTSYHFEVIDESSYNQTAPQVHVHYGTPATATTPLR